MRTRPSGNVGASIANAGSPGSPFLGPALAPKHGVRGDGASQRILGKSAESFSLGLVPTSLKGQRRVPCRPLWGESHLAPQHPQRAAVNGDRSAVEVGGRAGKPCGPGRPRLTASADAPLLAQVGCEPGRRRTGTKAGCCIPFVHTAFRTRRKGPER